jgi:hypothetical protein
VTAQHEPALEAREALGVVPASAVGGTLSATSRPRCRSRARYTSPMPDAESGEDFV